MSKVLFEVTQGVAVLTFNRPDRLNALDAEAHALLAETWVEIKARRDIRALIVTGNGRGFCVGMDLKAVGERGAFRETDPDAPELQTMTPLSNDIWIPTIVAVNGVCAGGGLHFVADADIVVASTAATFTDPHVTYGQVAALEPIGLIPRIGLGNSLRLALLGRGGRFDAAEALRISLVDEVVEPDELLPRARELAAAIARNSPTALRRTKRAIWESLEVAPGEAKRHGFEAFRSHREHPDALEGPRAFAERRDPMWSDVDNSDW